MYILIMNTRVQIIYSVKNGIIYLWWKMKLGCRSNYAIITRIQMKEDNYFILYLDTFLEIKTKERFKMNVWLYRRT